MDFCPYRITDIYVVAGFRTCCRKESRLATHLLIQEGWTRHQERCREATFNGADGVVRHDETLRLADHPVCGAKVASRLFLDAAAIKKKMRSHRSGVNAVVGIDAVFRNAFLKEVPFCTTSSDPLKEVSGLTPIHDVRVSGTGSACSVIPTGARPKRSWSIGPMDYRSDSHLHSASPHRKNRFRWKSEKSARKLKNPLENKISSRKSRFPAEREIFRWKF